MLLGSLAWWGLILLGPGLNLWGLFKPLSGGGTASPCAALGLTGLGSFAGSDMAGLSVLIS